MADCTNLIPGWLLSVHIIRAFKEAVLPDLSMRSYRLLEIAGTGENSFENHLI